MLLTYDQVVHDYELPATEGKRGDPRWPAFARRYGFDIEPPVQWEVEALEPDELRRLVLAAVDPYVDRQVLAEQTARQEEQRRALDSFVRGWDAAGGSVSWPSATPGATAPRNMSATGPCFTPDLRERPSTPGLARALHPGVAGPREHLRPNSQPAGSTPPPGPRGGARGGGRGGGGGGAGAPGAGAAG
ncbi:hypothetical protein [Streptomyces sp. 8L]|uniref:hypothetical protein n=1 Tax=Streptomyces sp. 8L TaxID=2877242 RepID=UPI001CD4B4D6|nr:hypothetical protein [Streptomyces sp. 8L]MCA1224015.1 hypothetical protein [Streptomyces sp. 8L]